MKNIHRILCIFWMIFLLSFLSVSTQGVTFTDDDPVLFLQKSEVIPGDMNGDQIVNEDDLTYLKRWFGGEEVVLMASADINCDNTPNALDLAYLRQYLNGEVGELSYCMAIVESIEVVPSEKTLKIGETFRLDIIVKPDYGSGYSVSWSSDNPDVATVDAHGFVEAKSGGTAVITAEVPGGVKDECLVTVKSELAPTPTDQFTYEAIDETTCRITGYTGNEAVVNVPRQGLNGCTVVEIGSRAFSYSQITEITMPSTVLEIGEEAFSNCPLLSKVTLNNGIKKIGPKAFYSCRNLTNLYLPDSITALGGDMIYGTAVTKINYPASLTEIIFVFSTPTSPFHSDLITSIEVPEGVTVLPARIFSDCRNLANITLPHSLTEIGNYAFDRTAISSIVIPENVESIGDAAFNHCDNLEEVVFMGNTKTIGSIAFHNCPSLKELHLPDSIETIGQGCFSDTSIQRINFPLNYTEETSNILYNRTLRTLVVPEGVTDTGPSSPYLPALKVLYLPSTLETSPYLFIKYASLTELHCPKGSSVWNWAIENGYESILVDWDGIDPTEPDEELAAPTDFKFDAANVNDNAVSVSFLPVSGASGYNVYYSTNSTFSPAYPKVSAVSDGSGRMIGYINGLTKGTRYYFWAVAYNDDNTLGVVSNTVSTFAASLENVKFSNRKTGAVYSDRQILEWNHNNAFYLDFDGDGGSGTVEIKSFVMNSEPKFDSTDSNNVVEFLYGSSGVDVFTKKDLSNWGGSIPFGLNNYQPGQYVKIYVAVRDKNYNSNKVISGIQFALKLTDTSASTGFIVPMDNWKSANNTFGSTYNKYQAPPRNYHLGIDYSIEKNTSETVKAFSSGTVKYAEENSGYGHYVVIEHTISNKKVYSFYGHMSTLNVTAGMVVEVGTELGVINKAEGTWANGVPHLHFAVAGKLIKGDYDGYAEKFSGDFTDWKGVTFYDPEYIIANGALPGEPIIQPLTITSQPADMSVENGTAVEFSVRLSGGTDIYQYQWYRAASETENGTIIEGAVDDVYTFTVNDDDDSSYFYCVVTSGTETVTSNRAKLGVTYEQDPYGKFSVIHPAWVVNNIVKTPESNFLTEGLSLVDNAPVSENDDVSATLKVDSDYSWTLLQTNETTSGWLAVSPANGEAGETTVSLRIRKVPAVGSQYESTLVFNVNNGESTYSGTVSLRYVDVSQSSDFQIELKEHIYTGERETNTGIHVTPGSNIGLWPKITFPKNASTLEIAVYDGSGNEVPMLTFHTFDPDEDLPGEKNNYVYNDPGELPNPFEPSFYFPKQLESDIYWLTAIVNGSRTIRVEINVATNTWEGSEFERKLNEKKSSAEYQNADNAQKIILIAESQKGYKHDGYSGYGDERIPDYPHYDGLGNGLKRLHRFNHYGVYTGHPDDHWCASFISWCAKEAGISTDIIPKTALADDFRNDSGKKKLTYTKIWKDDFSGFNENLEKPQPGDIVTFMPTAKDCLEKDENEKCKKWSDSYYINDWSKSSHVALITAVTADGDDKSEWEISIIEGNASGKVGTRTLKLNETYKTEDKSNGKYKLQGISRPEY